MAQNSTIHWQTGTPKHPGDYLVTTKHHHVEKDVWRNNAEIYKNHWFEHYDEDVIAWCPVESIKPFKF